MIDTTLVYIERGGELLLMNRNKKENDLNEGKWVGVGGKFEPGESPEECMLREVYEETGLIPADWELAGVIDFVSEKWDDERMFLYRVTAFEGSLSEDCGEGTLAWIPREDALDLPMWEGDRYFLAPMLEGRTGIRLRVSYDADGALKSVESADAAASLISIESALLGCEIKKRLYAARDEAYRGFQASLIPGDHPWKLIGVRTPELRNLARELARGTGAKRGQDGALPAALLGWMSDLPHGLLPRLPLQLPPGSPLQLLP